MLSGIEQGLLGVLLIVLMMGLGSTLTLANFREILRRPKGPLIGLASQFGWMPLVAFALATLLELPDAMAISLIVVGCTPGGTTSNLFTYYAKADVALSVSMTAISSVAALVMMPLTLTLYSADFTDASFSVRHRARASSPSRWERKSRAKEGALPIRSRKVGIELGFLPGDEARCQFRSRPAPSPCSGMRCRARGNGSSN